MSTQPAGHARPWLGMMAASIAALVFLANPASAAEGQHARTVLKRLTVAADPMTDGA